jgi:diguanylate cyclase
MADAVVLFGDLFGENVAMRCEHAQELISARIHLERVVEEQALDDHLRSCAVCRDEQSGMSDLDSMLFRAYEPERDAVESLVDKVRAALQARGRPLNRCTVLLVDDEPSILLLFAGQLEDEFDVIKAGSAREAQAAFDKRQIDIIVADQRMPNMNGVELLEWVLTNHPQTQRLLWTGYGEFGQAVEAVNRGHVFRYLTKPLDIDAVRGALRDAARIPQLEREYRRVLREMSELNVQLEDRVRQRTRELEEANRELEQRTQTLEKFALTDGLTLLPNRKALDHFVERELYLCRRFPAPLAVAIIDADFFKDINTKYLHLGGDQVLTQLARCMSEGLRKIDMLGRWGGDEFMLIGPQTHRAGAVALAERLRALVEAKSFDVHGQEVPVTITIGLAVLEPGRSADYEQVKLAAAAALARAKANGRNCVEVVSVTNMGGDTDFHGESNAASA